MNMQAIWLKILSGKPLTEAGMRWWNALTKTERAAWLKRANSAVPADAWKEFKRSAAEPWLELKRASQLGEKP